MPQDRWKSFVYRSFVTCDDPNGFFECKTIRRSKSGSQRKEAKIEDVKSEKNLVTASVDKGGRADTSSKRSIDEFDRASSVQLKEVSAGAQKLSKVVDSLSEESFDGRSVDVAKDLLRGALRLQKSLLMLGKQQESPDHMDNLKKPQKEKYREGRANGGGLQRCYSERIGDHNNVLEFEQPRFSADGSSGDCYDELREAIVESFARQNLLPKILSEEKACPNRNLDLSPDIVSASSSQSSMFNSHDFASSDSSSSNLQGEKLRSSNVIAKLMGLEEFPSKPVESTPQNQLQMGKLLKKKKPIFDIDLPNARKPSFIVEKERPEQRTLGEIIEIMQFKGLVESKPYEGSKPKMSHSNVSDFADVAAPIVLIKPMRNSGVQKELPYPNQYTCGCKASDTDKMLKLWKIREGFPPKNFDPQNVTDIRRTVKTEKNAVKRISQEKRTKDYGEAIIMPSDKESKVQGNLSSTRTNTSVPVSVKPDDKKEVIEKGVDKIQKVAPIVRQAAESSHVTKPNSTRSALSKSSNQGKINSTKVSSSRESTVSKNQAAVPKCTTSSPNSRSRTKSMLRNSINHKKNVRKHIVADKKSAVVVENIEHTEVDIGINLKSEERDDMADTRITPPEQLSFGEVRDASDCHAKDDGSVPGECTVLITQQGSDVTCNKINNSDGNCGLIENGSGKARISIRDMLLSSASFLNHAEELFDTISGQNMAFEEISFHHCGMADANLISDCANELLECKCQQWSLAVYPSLQHPVMRSKICVSFGLLVAGICNGIENLKAYSKLSDEILLVDAIHAMLKRDLWGKGTATGTWDLGWKNGFTIQEVEQVVVHIEQLILSGIIEDLLLDYSL